MQLITWWLVLSIEPGHTWISQNIAYPHVFLPRPLPWALFLHQWNPSVWEMSRVIGGHGYFAKVFRCNHALSWLCTWNWDVTEKLFSKIVLYLDMSKINCPASKSGNLSQQLILRGTEPDFLLASLRWLLCQPWCLKRPPQRLFILFCLYSFSHSTS